MLMEKSIEMGTPIGEYGNDVKIWAQRPFGSAIDGKSSVTTAGATIINDEKLTVSELKLEQGSMLLITGGVRLKRCVSPTSLYALVFVVRQQRVMILCYELMLN
jgi:hypothetical protein